MLTKEIPKKGDRVVWRGKAGTVVDDYWKDRDRFSVLFDGSSEPLDFGAGALMLVPADPLSTQEKPSEGISNIKDKTDGN